MRWIGTFLALVGLSALPVLAVTDRRPVVPGRKIVDPKAADARAEAVDPAERSAVGAEARAFLLERGGHWRFTFDRRTARPVLVQGSGIPFGANGTSMAELEPIARAFVDSQARWLRPLRGELVLDPKASTVRNAGRLASVSFEWHVDGVRVEGASVFVRVNSGNVTQFGAPLVGPLSSPTRPTVSAITAQEAVLASAGDAESHEWLAEPGLLLQVEERDGSLDHRLVWVLTYRVPGRTGTWEGRVDARTGEVVAFRDTNRYGRVTGGVYPRTVHEQNEVVVPFPFVSVAIPESSVDTDAAGFFPNLGGGTGASLAGPWFDTDCQFCTNPAQAGASGFGGGHIAFGTEGADQVGNGRSTPADRNTFYHLNQVRRVAVQWLPGEAWLYTPIRSFTNIQDTCNAYYDGDVNFFRSGGGCNNTGEVADIVYHEWGHGIDLNTAPGDGATGEGTADVVSMHVTHSPLIGPGFRVDGSPVRNLDPAGPRGPLTTTNIGSKCPQTGSLGPLGYQVHCEGEIYGQTAWELAQALVLRHGMHTGWRASERIFFSSLPDAAGYLPSSAQSIYSAYLFADDDDGNLANGTPHASEIHAAFAAHGIAGAALPATPHCARPAQPVVSVTPACDGIGVAWSAVPGAVYYEVLRGELRLDQALFSVGLVAAPDTTFHDAEAAPGTDYWYVVLAVDGAGCESTIEAPVAARRLPQPVLSVVAVTPDDTPRGNRSGYPDPDEEVDLALVIENTGDASAQGVQATLTSTAPVVLLDGTAAWADIAPGASEASLDVLRFRADSPANTCGDLLRFRLDPTESTACATDESYFDVELGVLGYCDPTPACYVPPTFAGLASAAPGVSCAEIALAWQPAQTHCVNAGIRYNVYRSTESAFAPGPATLVAERIQPTTFGDRLLVPGATYHYIVRAYDTRSGEESNLVLHSAAAPAAPDIAPPLFAGIQSATTAPGCAATTLAWSVAGETCSGPVSYDVYRSVDPLFDPGPSDLVGTSLSPSFVDPTLTPGAAYTYVVRARDTAGNTSASTIRLTASAGIVDRVVARSDFEASPGGFVVSAPNTASTGNWEWGIPEDTGIQPAACAQGTRCWITGLPAELPDGNNNDVDGGDTTLLSPAFSLLGLVDPIFEYERWYTNDQGAAAGEDRAYVRVSADDGGTWTLLEELGGGTPLAWVRPRIPLPPTVPQTVQMRFRFEVSDRGNGSLVEAGFDDWTILDRDQGCFDCPLPVVAVGTILARREGDDVVLDWTADPTPGARFVIYLLTGPTFETAVRVGTVDGRTFVHEGAARLSADCAYRVSAIDSCGNESALE